jgi:hypothetical protein
MLRHSSKGSVLPLPSWVLLPIALAERRSPKLFGEVDMLAYEIAERNEVALQLRLLWNMGICHLFESAMLFFFFFLYVSTTFKQSHILKKQNMMSMKHRSFGYISLCGIFLLTNLPALSSMLQCRML